MSAASTAKPLSLATLALLAACIGCTTESHELPSAPGPTISAHRSSSRWSPWSEPVNLGAPVNSAFLDQSPALSRDGLHLYVSSNRTDLPGALGGTDLWVSRRACNECPWETPVNLGPVVNSASNEGGPAISFNERLLVFTSNRLGSNDIFVSRRADWKDDSGWEPPVNLGPDVNTEGFETEPYFQSARDEDQAGAAILYFSRGLGPGVGNDIYSASVTREGKTLGPAVLVSELSSPTANDAAVTLSADGRQIIFHSDRLGAIGNFDLWISTRRSIHDPWSTPENLGSPPNAVFEELQPNLSHDGRTLLFRSGPGRGGLGSFDIWMSTRTPSGDFDDDENDDEW